MSVELVLLDAEAAPMLQQLQSQCFDDSWSAETWSKQLGLKRYLCLGIREGESIVGYAHFSTVVDEAELLQIAVQPICRGSGFATELLTQGIEQLRLRQVERLMLEVRVSNKMAIALYKKLGFSEDGCRKDYYPAVEGREDALLFSYTISPY